MTQPPFYITKITIQNPIRKTVANATQFTHVVTSPYKIAFLFECKHSQKAILHGSEQLQKRTISLVPAFPIQQIRESLVGASLPTSLLPIAICMRRMTTHFSPQRFSFYSKLIIVNLFFRVKNFFIFQHFIPGSLSNMPKRNDRIPVFHRIIFHCNSKYQFKPVAVTVYNFF